jgi:hypothetical protein
MPRKMDFGRRRLNRFRGNDDKDQLFRGLLDPAGDGYQRAGDGLGFVRR